MKLIRAQITMFRHIVDSEPAEIQQDVTCLVGKNESGKMAFLQSLYRLNPARSNVKISSARQYPAWLEEKHRRTNDLEKHNFAVATFELNDSEFATLEARFGGANARWATLRGSSNSGKDDLGRDFGKAAPTIAVLPCYGSRPPVSRSFAGRAETSDCRVTPSSTRRQVLEGRAPTLHA